MNLQSFNVSTQGASHIKRNKECQDASMSYDDDICSIVIVCDGHGGDDYFRSAIGAKLACDIAYNNIRQFIDNMNENNSDLDFETQIRNLEKSIISAWNDAVKEHFTEQPFEEEELAEVSEKARQLYSEGKKIESAYGTTLIAAAVTDRYCFGIQIGDGKCVMVNSKGEYSQPIPWDDKCFLNATTSICDSDAINNFRSYYSQDIPKAIFLGTDGIDDCFISDSQLNKLYETILFSFETNDFADAKDELDDYLPRLSAKGSGDDLSISGIINCDECLT